MSLRSWTLGVVLCAAVAAGAQSEAHLRQYFEGKSVVVRLDMPASKSGVNIRPGELQPLNFSEYAQRLKRYGTSLRKGDSVIITRIKVKEKNIEFQLGGGGYGTLGDDTADQVLVSSAPKTRREKNLERDLKTEKDAAKRRQMEEELDALRVERRREDARLEAAVAQAEAMREDSVRRRALEGGSRFNLLYAAGVPASQLTPEALMDALDEWVDFAPVVGRAQEGPATVPVLRKGLSEAELRAIYGEPAKQESRQEGSLRVDVLTFRKDGNTLLATLVEGVLVRYNLTSE